MYEKYLWKYWYFHTNLRTAYDDDDPMIRVVAHIIAKPDKISETRTLLEGFIEPTRKEKGCVLYELHQNTGDPTEFTFIEEWDSEDDLENHLQSRHIESAFSTIAEICSAPPDVRRYQLLG